MKKEDRRVRRTKNLLQEALSHLIVEKGYESITVQDIIDQADVGRSTFYFHFLDKDQLLEWSFSQLIVHLKAQRPIRVDSKKVEKSGNMQLGISLAMLQHVKEHKELYKATVSKQSGTVVMHYIRKMLLELVSDEMTYILSASTATNIPHKVIVEFVVSTFLTVLAWWMEEEMPYTAEEIDRIFHRLMLSGINI